MTIDWRSVWDNDIKLSFAIGETSCCGRSSLDLLVKVHSLTDYYVGCKVNYNAIRLGLLNSGLLPSWHGEKNTPQTKHALLSSIVDVFQKYAKENLLVLFIENSDCFIRLFIV